MTAPTLMEVLAALDPEQHEVATAPPGPVCILAGAGSGKTRALTHRIAALVLGGVVDPRQVLALTFTARAAGELRGRLRQLGVDGVQARTFHASALRQLRYFWPEVVGGAPPDVVPTKAPLIAEASRRLRVAVEPTTVRDLAAEIEWAKVSEVSVDDYVDRASRSGREGVTNLEPAMVGRIYAGYEAVKRDRGAIDFEDVLLLSAAMMADDRSMSESVRRQYRTFLVDEYQDVSPIQQRLLDLWLGERDDLTVVGDPNQTIYSFAGATSQYLVDFPRRFPDAPVIRLQRNYRSTPEVVDVANRLLTQSGSTPSIVLKSQRAKGTAPVWVAAADETAEVAAAVERVRSLSADGVPFKEIAVLYRINAQSARFEEALTEAAIPYTIRGGERFFDRAEVKEAIALLRGAARAEDAGDEESLDGQVRAVLGTAGYQPSPPPGPSRARDRWESLAAVVELARELAAHVPDVTLSNLVDELQSRASAAHAPVVDAVTLSSLHAAKGLEWDAVLLVGLTDGMVPITYATTPQQVAEERRLLYVGITRAREYLTFSYARCRNAGDRRQRSPSRFLGAVNPQFGSPPARQSQGRAPRPASCRACGRALTTPSERKMRHCNTCGVDVDLALFEKLRTWRKATADEASVPAFVVFTDATLTAIAVDRPANSLELLGIPGIGQAKADKYGDGVLAVVHSHAGQGGRPSDSGEHAG